MVMKSSCIVSIGTTPIEEGRRVNGARAKEMLGVLPRKNSIR
jgi:hypothetical protein